MQDEYNSFSKSVTSIKAIAIFLITIYHHHLFREDFGASGAFLFMLWECCHMAMDLFMILSGMMLTISLVNKKDISWKEWYKKRALRIYPILIVIIIFLGIYDIFFYGSPDVNSYLIMMSGCHTLIFQEEVHIIPSYWFIPFILTCYLIFPLVFYALKKNFKLTLFFGILLYLYFLIFSWEIYEFTNKFFFEDKLTKDVFIGFLPRYFSFFFGTILGYIIGNDGLNKLFDNRIELLALISFIIFFTLGAFLFFYENEKIFPNSPWFLLRSLCYPMMSLSFIVFYININRNITIINRILEFPGKISYEVILINYAGIHIVSILFSPLIPLFFIMILSIIVCILLATPFYYLNRRMTREKKINDLFLTFILSLLIYILVFFLIRREIEFTDLFSIILISIIFAAVATNYFNIRNLRNFKYLQKDLH